MADMKQETKPKQTWPKNYSNGQHYSKELRGFQKIKKSRINNRELLTRTSKEKLQKVSKNGQKANEEDNVQSAAIVTTLGTLIERHHIVCIYSLSLKQS